MRVLSVDTTSSLGSVALLEAGALLGEEHLSGADTHSLHLLPAIERLLAALGLDASAIEGFAVAVGPGSFTGLRVGLSTVQGLALGAGRPCIGGSVLDVLASVSEGPSFALRDAFRGEVYWGQYDSAGESMGPPRVGPLSDVLEHAPPEAAFVGDVAEGERQTISSRVPGARFPGFPRFLAGALAAWAEPRLRAGRGAGPEVLRPLYVRGADVRKGPA
jgi:tRNA threonylcarbamoyladenosine biosynthesis protein TsaB